MMRRAITTATEAAVELARLPLRVTGRLLPARPRGLLELGADQLHAATELTIGSLLHVDDLTEQGRLRRAAADERATALRLWTRAGDERRQADLALAEERSQTAQRRSSARDQAAAEKAAAEERREKALHDIERSTDKRESAVKEAAAIRRAKASTKADQRRLQVLEAQEGTLDVADDAAVAADEAARLSKAASAAKRRRTS